MTITDFDVAIVEGDSHLSKWIVEQRRLNVQEEYLQLFAKYIPEGGTVADVGACLGDHTLSYAKMVGETGRVMAFEPNPIAADCLRYNFRNAKNVSVFYYGLGAEGGLGTLTEDENLGAAILTPGHGNIPIRKMDQLAAKWPRLDFLKIDAEGMESHILVGAIETIARLRPVMLIEVNRPVLALRHRTAENIFDLLTLYDYRYAPSEAHLSIDRPELDILALPKEKYGNE